MLKKLSVFLLTLLMLSIAFGVAQAENDLPELTLDELIAWKESTRPEYVTDDMLGKVISGNLYEEYYGITAAAAATPLRAFATCDRDLFQVGVTSTITVHPTGSVSPYRYDISPYRRSPGETDGYWGFNLRSSTNTLSIKPDKDYQYMVRFTVTASNGDYVSFYTKHETATKASLSDPTTVPGKVKAVIASEIKSGMTDREKALAIHNWLIYNAKYDLSLVNHDPDGVLLKGSGVCESYARAYQMFMSELGIPNAYVTSDTMNHAWNMIYVDGGWYHVDVTWDDPTGRDVIVSGYERTRYFCLTDSGMAYDHTWNDTGLNTPVSGKGPLYPNPEPISADDAIVGKNTITISAGMLKSLRFTAPSSGMYLFETEGSKDTHGHLYDANIVPLTNDDNSGKDDNYMLGHYLTKDQVVYIATGYSNATQSGTETVKISRVASASLGTKSVSIAAGKVSILSFKAPSAGLYAFQTIGDNNTYGYLYDDSLTLTDYSTHGGRNSNFLTFAQLKANQVIYIGIRYCDSQATGTETLHISQVSTAVTGNNAISVDAGAVYMSSFTAPSTGIYTFETTGSEKANGSLLDSNMTQIAQNRYSGIFQITQKLTKGQVVYVRLYYTDPSESGTNTLKISTVSSVSLGTKSFPLSAGKAAMFSFKAPAAGIYLFQTTGSNTTYGRLYDNTLNQVASNWYGGSGDNYLLIANLEMGQLVYISTEYTNSSASGTETLLISQVSTAVFGNNTISLSAGAVSLYSFTVPSTGIYTFETTGSASVSGSVLDSNMETLGRSFSTRSFQVTKRLTKGQVVYVNLYSDSSKSEKETLKISRISSTSIGENAVSLSDGKTVLLSLTIPADGEYAFETTGSKDTYGYLYDSQMNQLAYDDDSGNGSNFRIIQELKKGQVVVIGVKYYSSSESGTEFLSIGLYNPNATPSATLTTLTGRSFPALSSKPTLLFFAKAGCGNTVNMLNTLSGYDLSALNVVIVESTRCDLETSKSFFAQYASGIKGATIGYGGNSYMWTLIELEDPDAYSIATPAVFYIDANKEIVDFTTGADSSLISHISTNLGVTLRKTSFSGTRLVLPKATTAIEAEAFKGTAAKLIEIPAGCTSIASNAFTGCPNLKIILNHSDVAITPPAGVVVTDIP